METFIYIYTTALEHPHTWPLLFGLPAFLTIAGLAGAVYELANKDQ